MCLRKQHWEMPRTSVRGVSAWAEGHEVEAVGRCLRDLGKLGVGRGDSQADARCREWREQERQERTPGRTARQGLLPRCDLWPRCSLEGDIPSPPRAVLLTSDLPPSGKQAVCCSLSE